jgi:hypothetical protein
VLFPLKDTPKRANFIAKGFDSLLKNHEDFLFKNILQNQKIMTPSKNSKF